MISGPRRLGRRSLIALGALALAGAPHLAIACAVTTPLPREAREEAAAREAEAWLSSDSVWVAVVTEIIAPAAGAGHQYRLTPVFALQGGDPPELVLPEDHRVLPVCRYYRGLDRSGADVGSEFIIYARSPRPSAANVLVVSTAQVGDPLTRLAIDSTRAAQFRAQRGDRR